jgi:lauroyl/myristoyl acyltransferase
MVLKLLLKIMFDSDKKINNNSHYRIMGVTIMEFMFSQLGKPILRRLGTALGASLLTLGYTQEAAVNLETAFTSLGLILIDLVLSYKDRKK